MKNNTSHINTPTIGLNTDLNILNNKSYSYALNASISNSNGDEFMIQNTGSSKLKVLFPVDFQPIGKKEIPELDRTIFFLINSKTNSFEIGEVLNTIYSDESDIYDDCIDCGDTYLKEEIPLEKIKELPLSHYSTIINNSCLNFNINYPIDIEYRITNCGINLYFTDNLNQRRFLYLEFDSNNNLIVKQEFYTIVGFNDCNEPIYNTELDCNKLNYHPCFSKPCISLIDILTSGNLKAGTYQFLLCYSDKNGNALTNYFPSSNIIPIFEKYVTTITDYQTTKSISIEIDNLENQSFLYYNLVVVETINNATEFKLIGTFPTNYVSKDKFVYTGHDTTLKKLSPTDIFFKRPYYSTAKTITKANNYLFFSNLKEYKSLNLQRAVNNISLKWQTIAIDELSYKDSKNTFNYRTFLRDEVYAFGIIFEFCDGWETCAYSIPGHSPEYYKEKYNINVYDVIPNSNPDVITNINCSGNSNNKLWQVYNTAQKNQNLCEYKLTYNCEKPNCWEMGDFAYWESTEKYPNNNEVWGDLCNKPIRHHKFPDSCITHIHDSQCGSKHFSDNNLIHPIGVVVDHQSVIDSLNNAVTLGLITLEEKNKIKGYRIVRANRSGNKSIVAKGLLYDMWSYIKDSKPYYYPNYPYNDLSPDCFIAPDKTTYDQDDLTNNALPNDKPIIKNTFIASGKYTFHSPDTHFVNPSLGTILKLETAEYGESEGFFNKCEEQAKYKRMTFFSRLIALGIGIAAALSATEEKECVTYNIKSNYKILEAPLKNKYGDLKKEEIQQNLSGVFTLGTGSITTTNTNHNTNYSGSTETDKRVNTQDNSVCLALNTYDVKTGNKKTSDDSKIMTSASDALKDCTDDDLDKNNTVESYQRTTCTGTVHQLLSLQQTKSPIMQVLNPILSALLGSGPQIIQQVLIGMREMQIILDLINSLIPYRNYTIQYNSIGKYNNYTCVPNNIGMKIRPIIKSSYLEPINQLIPDTISTTALMSTYVNNWNRESSVYLQLPQVNLLLPPNSLNICVPADNSRVTMGKDGMNFDYKDLKRRFNRSISSFYASIKNLVPDQYGKIETLNYLETNSCTFNLTEEQTKNLVFGGDTFINRFALKRKVPFFLQSRFKQLDNSDVLYSELGNIGFPNYYFDSEKSLFERFENSNILTSLVNPFNLLKKAVGLEDSRLDVKSQRVFFQNGYIYLYSYGIPYFLVESDINVDYRYAENIKEKDFYPHNQDLENWLQEKEVPITEDNYYFYNKTYSKQNKESFICNKQFTSNKECVITHPNRVIYSENLDYSFNDFDSWRVFKGNSYYDFPLSDGKLISVDGIESDKILVRSENTSRIFSAYNVIPSNSENIQVETGGIFKSRPKEFATTDLGYCGTMHTSLLNTEYGHIWVDSKRGNIFNLENGGGGLDELTKNGMRNWFKQNLPFEIQKQFPEIDIDNTFKNIGISLCFDRRYNRMFITKLDYKPIYSNITYNKDQKQFYYNSEKIDISDKKYFLNKSWTLSYNFFTKTWVSFHSFKPNFYLSFENFFDSYYNNSLWSHNLTNRSFQVYYGSLEPFIIEYNTEASISNNDLLSLEYSLDVIRFQNSVNYSYIQNKTFNKAIIYNERQCSGLLEMIVKDNSDMSQIGIYPKSLNNKTQILTANSENIWRINNFFNLVRKDVFGLPLFFNTPSNDNKVLNDKALNYFKPDIDKSRIKSKQNTIRLINDKYSNYLFSFNFSQTNQNKSYR